MPGSTGGRRWPVAVALAAVLVLVAGAVWLILVGRSDPRESCAE